MKKTTATTYGLRQQRTEQRKLIYLLVTTDEVYRFSNPHFRDSFIVTEAIVLVASQDELDRIEPRRPIYSQSSLERPWCRFDDPDVRVAKDLAKQQLHLWQMTSSETQRWFREYTATNDDRLPSLLKIVNGLNHLENLYRARGGLMPVDWLAALRKAAACSRFSEPEDLLQKVAAATITNDEEDCI